MRKILLLIFIFTMVSSLIGEEIENRMVGPGIRYRSFYIEQKPWAIEILEIDLTNPYVDIESVKANNQLIGREKTSSMAKRNDRNGHWVVGAINADFFEASGIPVNCQVIDEKIIKSPNKYSNLGFYVDLKPFIEIISFEGKVILPSNKTHTINDFNRARYTDELIVYNDYFGSETETNIWGTEIRFHLIDEWAVNDTFRVVAFDIDSTQGDQAIPSDGGVLSGHGTAGDWLQQQVHLGDTLNLFLQLNPLERRIKEVVGGIPRIIRDGRVSIEEGYEGSGFATARHPRTGVGFSQDSTKLFLFTVDGRQSDYSVGMDLQEMATFMKNLGVYQAINLDGGGSTTMVVRNKIVNNPSDGSERYVANALLVISEAPLDTLSQLDISPDTVRVYQKETFQFNIRGIDRFYNPIDLTQQGVQWMCDPELGSINNNTGLFQAGSQLTEGLIIAESGSVKDSAYVIVDVPVDILLDFDQIYLRIDEELQLSPKLLDTGGNLHDPPFTEFEWQFTDSIAAITENGILQPHTNGQTTLTLQYDTLQTQFLVSIDVPGQGVLDNFTYGPERWTLTGSGIDPDNSYLYNSDSIFISEKRSLALQYQYEKGFGSAAYYFRRTFQIPGTPDVLKLWVYPDGNPAKVQGYFVDANNRFFTLNFQHDGNLVIDWKNEWKTITGELSQAHARGGGELVPPIIWKEFKVYFNGGDYGEMIAGTVYFDDFAADYFTHVPPEETEGYGIPKEFQLQPGFPNPYNPDKNRYHCTFQLHKPGFLNLTIYNLLGQKIYTMQKHFEKAGTHQLVWNGKTKSGAVPCAGIYLVDLEHSGKHLRQKLILVN